MESYFTITTQKFLDGIRLLAFSVGLTLLPHSLFATPLWADPQALWVGCLGCHGPEGKGQGSIPPLSTLSPEAFVQRFEAFADESQRHSVMHRMAKAYRPDEIRQMASILGRKTP
jgi:cytochrome c553